MASASRVEEAITAAHAALPSWRATSLAKRTNIFFKLRELLTQRKSELAPILTSEHGKVLSDVQGRDCPRPEEY